MSFTQVITSVGLAKIAAALAGGPLVNITEIAVGDADTTPVVGLTALGNEVWRGAANLVAEATPDRVRVEATIPVDEAEGYTLREAGAFDAAGDLILVARIPDTYKPDLVADGASVTVYLRLTVEIANAATALTLTVDPSTVLATKDYVDAYATPIAHLDGGASKHDASEIDDESSYGYHAATVQLTLDALSDGLEDHEDGGLHKHDATEIDYEASAAYHEEFGGSSSVQAALQIVSRALPIAIGIFKLTTGGEALVAGAGWDGAAPIVHSGGRVYVLKLSDLVRDYTTQALAIDGLVISALVSGKGAGWAGAYAYEVDPLSGGRTAAAGTFTLAVVLPDAHAGGVLDSGPVAMGAPAAADEVFLHVVVHNARNALACVPALVVTP